MHQEHQNQDRRADRKGAGEDRGRAEPVGQQADRRREDLRLRRSEAAAQHYYGVSAAQLSAEQAAKLAAMVPNPRFYDRNREAPGLMRKTGIILERMGDADIP